MRNGKKVAKLNKSCICQKLTFQHENYSCTSKIYLEQFYKEFKRNTESPWRSMQYQPLLYISNGQEMATLKNDVNLSKITFSVL